MDDRGEGRGVDETHEEEGLKYGVGELRGLFKEFDRFGWITHYQAFHLREDVEELRHWKSGERLRDGVWAGQVRCQVDTRW